MVPQPEVHFPALTLTLTTPADPMVTAPTAAPGGPVLSRLVTVSGSRVSPVPGPARPRARVSEPPAPGGWGVSRA